MDTSVVLDTPPQEESSTSSSEEVTQEEIQTPHISQAQPDSPREEFQQLVEKIFPALTEIGGHQLQDIVSLDSLKLFDLSLEESTKEIAESNSAFTDTPVSTTAQTRCPPSIILGEFEIETWYSSPYPDVYACSDFVYLCQFCFGYQQKSIKTLIEHVNECQFRLPPGKKIYGKDDLSVFEVDGRERKEYCQNLCLLSKMFLESKILYYDVDPFLFYILTRKIPDIEADCHVMVGYFSKEKGNKQKYNVSCIMVLPPEQRKGYGRFLIDFSYLLSRTEKLYGTPERPLSQQGQSRYMKYWKSSILEFFRKIEVGTPEVDFKDIREQTGICDEDIMTTLKSLNFITKPIKGIFNWKINWTVVQREEVSTEEDIVLDVKALNWEPPKCESIARQPKTGRRNGSGNCDSAKDGRKRRKLKVKVSI